MQDPFGSSNRSFQRPKLKPPRKQVGLLQSKGSSQSDSVGKSVTVKVRKKAKKIFEESNRTQCVREVYGQSTSARSNEPAARSVMDATFGKSNSATYADSQSMYKALKRKYKVLREERFKLAEGLEITDRELKILEEEKHSLLDELLVLEGLAFNPYPPVQTLRRKTL